MIIASGPAVAAAAQAMIEPHVAEQNRRPAEMKEFYADDWLFVGLMSLKAGEACEQHVHEYDHPTVFARGTFEAWGDGVPLGRFVAPRILTIKAGVRHKFLAVTDGEFLCCHNLRGEGEPAVRKD